MPTILYLARHATPDWTRTELSYHLPPGPPLTEEGEKEAEDLGKFFRKNNVSIIFTSPLDRCYQTAKTAGEASGTPVEIVHSLTEWQPGENYASVASRMWPTIKKAIGYSNQFGPTALITHGGPIAALLGRMGMDADVLASHRIYDNNNPLPPAGVWQAVYLDNGESWEWKQVFKPN
jgi:broad specificity phosphatase PhoE